MAEGRVQRRLAAILVADVVGYSRLMGADEESTLRTLKSYRESIDHLIVRHEGHIFSTGGDSILAEFSSAVEAVRSAIAIQEELTVRNADLIEDRKMRFRIGINVGDVMVEGNNLLGDSVNVAARLEGVAEPGGICISGSAYDQVRNKLSVSFEDIGPQQVKNIAQPVPAFRVVARPVTIMETTETPVTLGRWRRLTVVAAVAVILAAGGIAWWWPRATQVEPASIEKMALKLPEKPSIAVLPFDNMSNDPAQDILVDGLVEDIITSLSKIPNLFVISRNSTFAYKGKALKIKTIAEELGVRYVLEGSIRSSSGKKRITAQLIDAVAGYHVWANSYDRDLKDVFALQSEIALKIVTELDVKLMSGERARLQRRTTSNPAAYEAFLRAEASPTATRENSLAQIKMYEQAIELDPNFSAAWAAASIRQARLGRVGWLARELAYKKADVLARKAIAADDSYSGAYLAMSTVHRFRGEFEQSLALVEKALSLAPNDADAIMYKGRMLRLLPGRGEEAISLIKSAMRLNPHYPADYVSQLSWAYFAAGRYREAHDAALKYATRQPHRDHAHWRLALTYSLLGQSEKARAAAAETLRINPNRTITNTLRLSPYAKSNPALLKAEIDAMRAAGFPEE